MGEGMKKERNRYVLRGRRGPYVLWRTELKAHDVEEAVAVAGHQFERVNAEWIEVDRVLEKGELLLCPFCGGEAKTHSNPNNPTFEDWVQCTKCCARSASDDSFYGAVREWNTRVNLEHVKIMQDNEGLESDAPLMEKIQEYDDFFYELLEWLANGEIEYKPQGGEAEDRIFLDKDYIQERAEKLLGDRVN